MARRFRISLPDYLADILCESGDASTYVADAIRMRRSRESARLMVANAGYAITNEGIRTMRERVRTLEALRIRPSAAGEGEAGSTTSRLQ